ncbi:MAG TPA: PhoH family protein, partial [Sphingomonas sp.]
MSRKPVPAQPGDRSRVEVLFDKPQLLSTLFGQYDHNLVALENRLGVYITARGNRVGLEGTAEQVALARDVLQDLYKRIGRGEDVDAGLVDASIAMAAEPELDGIVRAEQGGGAPPIMIRTRKKTIVPRTPAQAHYMRSLTSHEMIFALGPAGTGKTYVAVAQAVAQLITGSVQRLILSRPAVEAGERLGFLPGDMKEKVDPYLRPLYDALYDCLPAEQVERRIASGEIEVAPIAFMRGRTLA